MLKFNSKNIIYLLLLVVLLVINYFIFSEFFGQEDLSPRAKKVFNLENDILRSESYGE